MTFELREKSREVRIGETAIGGDRPWALIAGPCAIESEDMAFEVAEKLRDITAELDIPYIFKGSFDKANRMSLDSDRGIGIDGGLRVLSSIRERFGIPVLTDIHEPAQAAHVAKVVDCLQIPAFLCRQTDLTVAAAKTGLPVNIKMGQFVSPEDMAHIAQKAERSGDGGIMLTERGTTFGYRNLIVDFRGIDILSRTGWPVIMDVSHSQQQPGSSGGSTGGSRHFIPHFAIAALALGADAIFIEVHPDPKNAISDKKTQWPLSEIAALLIDLKNRYPE